MKINRPAFSKAAHIGSLSLLVTLIACGGGGGDVGGTTRGASASVTTQGNAPFYWHTTTSSVVVLKDANGVQVQPSAVTCAPQDPQQVQVNADCSQITPLRLGTLNIQVSGNGATATLAVASVTQRLWTGTHGASSSNGSGDFSFVTLADGSLLGWGANVSGALGLNKSAADLAFQPTPTAVLSASGSGSLAGVAQGSAGLSNSLALTLEGLVWAWGNNAFKALGNASVINQTLLPVPVLDLTARQPLQHVVQVETGGSRGVALIDDGTVVAWGQWPGNNTTNSSSLPTQVLAPDGATQLQNIVAVSAGNTVSLALDNIGQVYAWGFDVSDGSLGSGAVSGTASAKSNRVVKADGSPLTNIVQISAGYNFSLALASDGTVWSWGSNDSGQVGSERAQNTKVPFAVQIRTASGSPTPLSGISMVAAGGNHALALTTDGRVYAWGLATSGQLGDGAARPAGNAALNPRLVVTQTGSNAPIGAVSVAAGYKHSMVLLSDGSVLSWGDNFNSALGRVTAATSDPTPGPVLGLNGAGNLNLAPLSNYPNLLLRAR
ncbi:MAG: RCC1 domain-containing protein [Leptothrix sp. (in: b-proteobacteria)]